MPTDNEVIERLTTAMYDAFRDLRLAVKGEVFIDVAYKYDREGREVVVRAEVLPR